MKLMILVLVLLLTGCMTPPRTTVQTVQVAVPTPCKAERPSRPIMPTDALPPNLPRERLAFELLKAAKAEIIVRQAYEDRLLAALNSCL